MTSVTNRRRDILGKLSVQPGFGLLRNLFRIPCTFSPASGCCATHSAFLARSARLRVAAQLIPHSLPVQPGFGLLRNSSPWQASLWLSPISAPVFAYGLPGRKKGNQISLVAFVKPGGVDETRTHDPHTASVVL